MSVVLQIAQPRFEVGTGHRVAGVQIGGERGQLNLPVGVHLVVHPHGGRFVDRDDHRFARLAAVPGR